MIAMEKRQRTGMKRIDKPFDIKAKDKSRNFV